MAAMNRLKPKEIAEVKGRRRSDCRFISVIGNPTSASSPELFTSALFESESADGLQVVQHLLRGLLGLHRSCRRVRSCKSCALDMARWDSVGERGQVVCPDMCRCLEAGGEFN